METDRTQIRRTVHVLSLGLLAAMFNGSGGCALGSLGLFGSAGCAFDDCVEAVCCVLELGNEPKAEFGELPVLLPGSGAGG